MLLATLKYGRISKTHLITEVAEASGLPRRELEDQGLDCSSSAMGEIDHQIQDSECYFAHLCTVPGYISHLGFSRKIIESKV